MERKNGIGKLLIAILSLSFLLGIFGLRWGLPEHWHVDEKHKIETVLQMAASRDLNPQTFVNPSLHLYLLLIALMPYGALVTMVPGLHLNMDLVYVFSRLLSVCMGCLSILTVYAIAHKVFDRRAALFSALALTLTMGFVNIVHFAIPEATVTLLSTLTVLICLYLAETGKLRYYLFAGAGAGLALSAKYTVWVLIVPMVVSFFMSKGAGRSERSGGRFGPLFVPNFLLGVGAVMIAAAYAFDKPSFVQLFSPDRALEAHTLRFLESVQNLGQWCGLAAVTAAIIARYNREFRALLTAVFTDKRFLLMVTCMVVFFFFGTPYAVLDSRAFLNGIIDDWDYARGHKLFSNTHLSGGLYFLSLVNIFGFPLFLACLAGLGYGLFRVCRGDKYVLILWSWVGAFYLFLGLTHHYAMRFIIPLVPVMTVFAGAALAGSSRVKGPVRVPALIAVGLILLCSFMYTVAADLLFVHDSRYKARAWIVQHVARGSRIDTYSSVEGSLPEIPAGFQVRRFAQIEDTRLSREEFEIFLRDYWLNKPDVILLTGYSYRKYFDCPAVFPERTEFYRQLIGGGSGYTVVSRFGFRAWWAPDPEGVDPEILILKRATGS